ncbi:MAG: hypothetical protein Q8K33_22205 [Cypionkella sp.]|uniref:hypothetical protein n=1 Tax=Cypionkella sp. TaxID=2811411 RepID=UPI002731C949|nr:hypothetical protein [Cypionkella sp.]MDP2051540.1 hypothetical protein [Cypionkella sp.]
MKFNVRAFVANSGGAYDPAPLHDFDTGESESPEFIPQVGDVLRWDETQTAYKVIERFFDYSQHQCALLVEPFEGHFIRT